MQALYCIKHERMVDPYPSPYAELSHTDWIPSMEGIAFEDLDYCDFEQGWATCPPPESILDEYIERFGNPPAIIEEDFLPYTYDTDRDEIMEEVFA